MDLEASIREKDQAIQTIQALILANQNLQWLNQNQETELANLKARCEQYMQAHDQLQHQVQELLRYRFGKKSERFMDPESPQQSLFDDSDDMMRDDQGGELEETEVKAHVRKKKTSNKELSRRIEIIPVSEADRTCSCGCQKKVIRYEKKELLNYQPAIFEIIEQRREVVACENGCDGSIKTAPAPLQVLPKLSVSESFLAFLVVSKLDDRQPLYHLEKQLNERYGVDCSRQAMAGWMIALMGPMQPLYNLCKDQVIEYDVAACDATTLQVLNEPGRKAETKSYMYCMRGGSPGCEVVLYEYNDQNHKKNEELSSQERYELRQKESKPLLEAFKKWLDAVYPTVLPQSALGKAIQYCFNRWEGLMRFLEDGRLEIDNNLTEQKIKPIVIARKNFLFAYSVAGAKALCMHFSFIQTAKLHGHDPYHYYCVVLKRLPHCQTLEDYEKLLPWNMSPNDSKKGDTS